MLIQFIFKIKFKIDILASSSSFIVISKISFLENTILLENNSIFPVTIRGALQVYYREAIIFTNSNKNLNEPMSMKLFSSLKPSWRAVQTEMIIQYDDKLLKF